MNYIFPDFIMYKLYIYYKIFFNTHYNKFMLFTRIYLYINIYCIIYFYFMGYSKCIIFNLFDFSPSKFKSKLLNSVLIDIIHFPTLIHVLLIYVKTFNLKQKNMLHILWSDNVISLLQMCLHFKDFALFYLIMLIFFQFN